jgi:hypothetical protein
MYINTLFITSLIIDSTKLPGNAIATGANWL